MARPSTRARAMDKTAVPPTQPEELTSERADHAHPASTAAVATKTMTRNRRPARKMKPTTQTDAQIKALDGLKARMLAEKAAAAGDVAPAVTTAHFGHHERRSTTSDRRASKPQSSTRSSSRPASVKSAAQIVAEELEKAALAGHDASPIASPSSNKADANRSTDKTARPKIRSSLTALANFQRRKRQPSLLAMVQQTGLDRVTTHGESVAVDNAVQDSTAIPLDTSVEDVLADFLPDNESTPVNVLRPSTRDSSKEPVRKELDDHEDLYGYSPQPERTSRKRKSDEMADESEIQIPRSPVFAPSPSRRATRLQRQQSTTEVIPSTQPTENQPEGLPTAQHGDGADPQSDIYADPASSSPPPSSVPDEQFQPTAAPTGRRAARTATGNIPPAQNSIVTSADLRALLPRRRVVRHDDSPRDDFDIPSSSGVEDDSRLEAASRRRRAAARKPTTKSTAHNKTKTISARPSRKGPRTKPKARSKPIVLDSSDKENNPTSSPPAPSSSPGLPAFTDHQNSTTAIPSSPTQPSNDSNETTPRPKKKSEDLQAAAEKFKEIDQWDLEFESAPSLGDRAGHEYRAQSGTNKGRKTKGRRVEDEVGRCSSGSEWR